MSYSPPPLPSQTPISRPASPLLLVGGIALGVSLSLLLLGTIAGVYYFWNFGSKTEAHSSHEPSLQNVASWQQGNEQAQLTPTDTTPHIGWWTKTFNLPPNPAVIQYLDAKGLHVTRLVPVAYQDDKTNAKLTYQVYAQVPGQLLHLNQATWQPSDPDQARFTSILVLNQGLPAGHLWDAQNPTVAAEANTKLSFNWSIHDDKTFNTLSTDRIPLPEQVFTPQEVKELGDESATQLKYLTQELQAINQQVKTNHDTALAQIPSNPPRPDRVSSKFGGSGSGEPTRSGERIGGGAVAGAAAGAGFGAVAGDAGLGAGIGAGAGLLGGLVYDMVSKSNDRKRQARAAAAANDERLDEWRTQIHQLNAQRADVENQSKNLKEKLLGDLAAKISNQKGRLTGNEITAPNPIPTSPLAPTSDTPTGPIGPVTTPQ